MTNRTAKQTYLRIPPDLLDRIDAFRRKQLIRPSLTETIRGLIERGLEEMEKGNTFDATDCQQNHRQGVADKDARVL